MKVFLMTDLEGVCGVDQIGMLDETSAEYQTVRRFLMRDVNAAVDGAIRAGADEILVFDGHGGGRNFLPGGLDARAVHITQLTGGILDGVGAYLEVGCHAMAGTTGAFLDHTQSSTRWFEYRINGSPAGELAQGAAWCGAHGVPFVMVSGDRAACEEAGALIPGIACAAVKTAVGRNRAQSMPEELAVQRISQAAERGIRNAPNLTPYRIDLPARISLTVCRSDYCDEIAALHPEYRRDGRTLTKNIESICDYRDLLF